MGECFIVSMGVKRERERKDLSHREKKVNKPKNKILLTLENNTRVSSLYACLSIVSNVLEPGPMLLDLFSNTTQISPRKCLVTQMVLQDKKIVVNGPKYINDDIHMTLNH